LGGLPPVVFTVRFTSAGFGLFPELARTGGAFLEGILPVALPAAAFRAAAAPARAGAFPRPAPSFPPAGRPADDVRLGFARRFAFAMRSRYLLIKRDVNGAARFPCKRDGRRNLTLTVILCPLPWCWP